MDPNPALDKNFTIQKSQLIRHLNQKIKKIQKRIIQLEQALVESSLWNKVNHEAELIKANFQLLKRGMKELSVADWETDQKTTILLDPQRTPQEELSLRYKKARKLQRGIPYHQERLSKASLELHSIEKQLLELNATETLKDLEKIQGGLLPPKSQSSTNKKGPPEKLLPYKEYLSETGVKIWVGKSAKANDQLTFVFANGSDWWMHVHDFPGSHVVIKTVKGKAPDAETLADAMQLALYNSKARERGEGEVCVTQRKYLSRIGKQLGKVQVSKHKTVAIRFDPIRFQKVKDRRPSN